MLKEAIKKHFSGKLGRQHYFIILVVVLCILSVKLYCSVSTVQNEQKNSFLQHAAYYSSLMDAYVTEKGFHPSEKLSLPDELLIHTESQGTFAVIKDGKVLCAGGANLFSHQFVASIADSAADRLYVYANADLNLPDYYFYSASSRTTGLDYCYYEPAVTGRTLLQKAFSANRWQLLVLSSAAILAASLFIASAPEKAEKKRIVEITVPEHDTLETSFGSLPYFGGIIIDYHSADGNAASLETLKLLDQIIRENLLVNKISYQVSNQCSSDYLQYYMNYVNYNLRVLSDSLKMNLYNAAPDIAINIYYSISAATCQEMENDLLYLHQHLRYSLFFGYGRRLSSEQIRAFEASTAILDANVAGTIQNHLRTRAYDDLYHYLGYYRNTLKHYRSPGKMQYSFSELYRFAEEAFSAVKMFFQEDSFDHPMVHTTCINILRGNPGFDAFCEYLISCIQSYQQTNQHVLSSRNEQIMNSIYMYIEEDLAGANLNSIARKMQMTDSHLSRVFKKNTGCNFSEYLSERKLEEAARLLVQDNKMKVAEISDLLGYGSPTYFLSRFKARYGVSPSAYRKAHTSENARKS